ncbi:ATP-binding protein [Lactococcus petauri]|jgi:adenylate kinase family enzyme|uniref:AAA+ ATPase domain-containing protein n=2 Tax=Lactococcus petauri TaxID=1940789 RepID=A0A252CFE8_9LACT|nr:ATP-binding protein [Lactococcus petauri]OUK05253.1 hypothetical protein BZZ03_00615 [Lactococcus petauri]USI68939.1 ATP-binding protein [Lactococcus petauri]
MKIKNLLLQPGNVSILGNPGTGKTTLLKLIVEEAITLNEYDKIIIYTLPVNNIEWSEFKKNKKIKLIDSHISIDPLEYFINVRKLVRSNKSNLIIIDDLDNFLGDLIQNNSVRKFRVSEPNMSWNFLEKSDMELAIDLLKRDICSYPPTQSKFCIANYRDENILDFSFSHEIEFNDLENTYDIGDFQYTTKHNLGNYLEENREDYWGNY